MSDELDAAVGGARAYEELHVPALFRQWAGRVLDAARVRPGDRVLDVACGTGVLAGEALSRVGETGSVSGLDMDAGMLTVAGELHPAVRWVEGAAGDLPFDDGEFDAVVSQFGFMFFPDRRQAMGEMLRCTDPDGSVVVAVWDALDRGAPYAAAIELLERRAGAAAADALRAPFALGDTRQLEQAIDGPSRTTRIETVAGIARFPSVRAMVEADLRGWLPVMGIDLDEETIEQVLTEADELLAAHRTPEGEMVFEITAHIATITPS